MVHQKRYERKRRPTAKEVGQAIDLFRPFPTIDAKATNIKLLSDRGNLRAFVNVRLFVNGSPLLLLSGVRVVRQQGQKPYVQMPCQQSKRDGKYYPTVKDLDPNLARKVKKAALDLYELSTNGF